MHSPLDSIRGIDRRPGRGSHGRRCLRGRAKAATDDEERQARTSRSSSSTRAGGSRDASGTTSSCSTAASRRATPSACSARVERFDGRLQLQVRTVEPSEADPAELAPAMRSDADELQASSSSSPRSSRTRRSLPSSTDILSDPEIRDGHAAAARRGRGRPPRLRGWAARAHVGVATLCRETAQLHPRLRSDLLLSAALLHDVGRVRELGRGPAFRPTPEGALLGHVQLGVRLVDERARRPRAHAPGGAPARDRRAPRPRGGTHGRGARPLPREPARRAGGDPPRRRPEASIGLRRPRAPRRGFWGIGDFFGGARRRAGPRPHRCSRLAGGRARRCGDLGSRRARCVTGRARRPAARAGAGAAARDRPRGALPRAWRSAPWGSSRRSPRRARSCPSPSTSAAASSRARCSGSASRSCSPASCCSRASRSGFEDLRLATGVALALVAALGFGLFVVGLDAASDDGVAVDDPRRARTASTLLALVAALVVSAPLRPPARLLPMIARGGCVRHGRERARRLRDHAWAGRDRRRAERAVPRDDDPPRTRSSSPSVSTAARRLGAGLALGGAAAVAVG